MSSSPASSSTSASATLKAAAAKEAPSPSYTSNMRSQQQQPFFMPFDPESPLFVAKGVLSTGALGALTGASIGVVRNQNPFALSINMTINLSIAGLTFFSIREYLVSPLLLSIDLTPSHTRRYTNLLNLSEKQLGKLPSTSAQAQAQSLTEVRLDRVADSALAGALTGGVLSAAFRGRATFGKAALTSSLIASALQLGVNQLRVFRLKALAKHTDVAVAVDLDDQRVHSIDVATAPADSPNTSRISPMSSTHPLTAGQPPEQTTGQNGDTHTPTIFQSFEDPLKAHDPLHNPSPNSTAQQTHSASASPSFPERMMTSLSKFLPVRKLSDDEYIATLEKKRADVDKRLKEIDDEEKRMYAWAEEQAQRR
ncbi:hypothetical protein I317_04109 [Kwoniella heveanensis CBS 569]|nr:hypothetical protein I317_04109 [Kwoniella heveanensis CBS 569]